MKLGQKIYIVLNNGSMSEHTITKLYYEKNKIQIGTTLLNYNKMSDILTVDDNGDIKGNFSFVYGRGEPVIAFVDYEKALEFHKNRCLDIYKSLQKDVEISFNKLKEHREKYYYVLNTDEPLKWEQDFKQNNFF